MSAIGHTDAAFGASFKCLDLMLQLASPCILQPSHIVGFGGGGGKTVRGPVGEQLPNWD